MCRGSIHSFEWVIGIPFSVGTPFIITYSNSRSIMEIMLGLYI